MDSRQLKLSPGTAGRLFGKVALVTGAASGIGEAIARRFHEEGATVTAVGLQEDLLQTLSTQTGITVARCDVTRDDDVRLAITRAYQASGQLDIVVNAAGIVIPDDVAAIDDDDWDRTIDVNLAGAMRVCRAAIQTMGGAGGSIVNIASVAAFNASPGMASYAASKAGLVALTRSIANRYGAQRIRANCLCPGWTRTPMSDAEMELLARQNGTSLELEFEAAASRIALRRIASPAEIAACALFLASDDSSFVTGAVLVADGGARAPATARAY